MSDHHDRRSPYIVLGIDYGTSPDEARHAFARRARQVRRSGTAVYDIEDLTWALHTIESLDDPAASVEYFRVPAHRATTVAPAEGELFRPAPIPAPRRSQPVTPEQLSAIKERVAAELVERLLTTAAPIPCDDPYNAGSKM